MNGNHIEISGNQLSSHDVGEYRIVDPAVNCSCLLSTLNDITKYLDYDMIFNNIVSNHVSIVLNAQAEAFYKKLDDNELCADVFYFVEEDRKK